jgi:hypothetical protein
MIDVKQAAQSASEFVGELFPANTVSDVRLEEVELSEDGSHWLITLSFPPPASLSRGSSGPFGVSSPAPRQYKIFKIKADTGEVQSMKIRELSREAS